MTQPADLRPPLAWFRTSPPSLRNVVDLPCQLYLGGESRMAAAPVAPLSDPVVFGDPQLHTDGDLAGLAFAPDGTLWSVEEPGVVRHWNVWTGHQLGHQ